MEKLIRICKESKANTYVTGPSAKNYFDESLMEKEDINVKWMNYNKYKEYNQLHSPFSHEVSIIDLLFNEGKYAKKYMKSFKGDTICK